ncbi:hypothetical protein [Streptomyces antibioticus]|uniref:hypothetical protein n=1 Tax=Streptomyces antibioticus TaxID=1890 RepID=UPI0036945E3C
MNDPFTGPGPREVRPGEHPAWDEALALVNRDLAALLPGRGPLRLLAVPSDADDDRVVWECAGGRGSQDPAHVREIGELG